MSNSINRELVLDLVSWCRRQMESSGGKRAVLGLSGGKDSTVVAALLARAIGADNVYALIMPDNGQADLDIAIEICENLNVQYRVVDISSITHSIHEKLAEASLSGFIESVSEQTKLNLPPRVRMSLLFAFSQSIPDSRVINTSNLSEDWVGYVTLYGDTAGAFAPLGMLTSDEVIAVGRELGIPERFLTIPPADGLTGRTDEEVFGFSYDQLNSYIRTGELEDKIVREKIDNLHKSSRFKFLRLPMFRPPFRIGARDIAGIYNQEREDN
ncbi:MAG TPA: NAD(+) synthase [Clostridiaceae bacterium]|nr:NAD(+) synthase [Clostridiaceae bacterium]